MMLTDAELKKIEERCEKATPGPWNNDWTATPEVFVQLDNLCIVCYLPLDDDDNQNTLLAQCNNAEFIAAARTDIPKLLQMIDVYRMYTSVPELLKQLKLTQKALELASRNHMVGTQYWLNKAQENEAEYA